MKELKVTSPAFENKGFIPKKYTCDGEDVNPPLNIEGIPEGAKSLVLIVDDPDAPMGT
ncbi:TPA: YbhB/YbcL family Raf kinase inhibitor-like protein, partial [Candidatus Bathyarchaeota archaeon]|nr:YbhB/YbcL family Raf kinase inhibitor-like protein [Candidatus Bathyarchaeota archaeon]